MVLALAARALLADPVPELLVAAALAVGLAACHVAPSSGRAPAGWRQPEISGWVPGRCPLPVAPGPGGPPRRLAPGRLPAAPFPCSPRTVTQEARGGLVPLTAGAVTFGPCPVTARGLAVGGSACRRFPWHRSAPGGRRSHGTSPGGRVARRVLTDAAGRRRAALGGYGTWPPAGAGAAGRGLPHPFGKIIVVLAVAAPTAAPGASPVACHLSGTGRSGAGEPGHGRPETGRVSGCPAALGAARSGVPEKLSAPEQNSGAEGDRREDAHGDRQVDKHQAGRDYPGHESHHRRSAEEGAGPDHVRPPTARHGAPGCPLPAVV